MITPIQIDSYLEKPADGRLDRRFATIFDDGVLWYDAAEARILFEKK